MFGIVRIYQVKAIGTFNCRANWSPRADPGFEVKGGAIKGGWVVLYQYIDIKKTIIIVYILNTMYFKYTFFI